jgi:hypothetical protein
LYLPTIGRIRRETERQKDDLTSLISQQNYGHTERWADTEGYTDRKVIPLASFYFFQNKKSKVKLSMCLTN